jgi:serine/threonine protein kinase
MERTTAAATSLAGRTSGPGDRRVVAIRQIAGEQRRAVATIEAAMVERVGLSLDGLRAYADLSLQVPGLLDVVEVGKDGGDLWYAMPAADADETSSDDAFVARSASTELARRGVLPLEEAAAMAHVVLDAVEPLHGRGMLHRGIRPSNILWVDGQPQLGAFGLPDERGQSGAQTEYAPRGGVLDSSGDLYCVGTLLFQLVTGAPSDRFPEVPADLTSDALRDVRKVLPVIDRACAPRKSERFETVAELRAALETLVPRKRRKASRAARPAPDEGGGAKGRSKTRLVLVALAVVAVAAAVALLV